MRKPLKLGAVAVALAVVMTACGDSDDGGSDSNVDVKTSEDCATRTKEARDAGDLKEVSLQLQWVSQAQFAGYYAAVAECYYVDEGLDVNIVEGGVDIVPQDVLASGDVDYAISWVPKVLGSIEQGAGITNVAQIFERSATTQVSFKDKNIAAPDSRARTSAAGASATSGSCSPACSRGRQPRGHQPGPAGVRHERVPGRRHRRRAGHDLQRVRAGPRDGEPGHRLSSTRPTTSTSSTGTTSARRCSRTRSGRRPRSSSDRLRGADGRLHQGVDQGLGVRRDNPEEAARSSPRPAPSSAKPPAVDGQRGQQADLAVDQRRRDDRRGRVGADRRHRPQHRERDRRDDHHRGAAGVGLHQRVRRAGARRARGGRRRHHRSGLRADRGRAEGGSPPNHDESDSVVGVAGRSVEGRPRRPHQRAGPGARVPLLVGAGRSLPCCRSRVGAAPGSGTTPGRPTSTSPASWSTSTSATSTRPSSPAIQEQAATLATIGPATANLTRGEAAKRIAARAPEGFNKVFFTNGGADAIENAIRMARLHTGRDKVVSTYRSYHGNTGGAIVATGDWRRIPNEYARGHVHVFGPYLYRSEFWATRRSRRPSARCSTCDG